MIQAAGELGTFAREMQAMKRRNEEPTQQDDFKFFQLQHKFYFTRDAYVAVCKKHGVEPEELRTHWE